MIPALLAAALALTGVPYAESARAPQPMDCSLLVAWALAEVAT